ncbi:MAG: hypothetical protein GY835_19820 [bacterium]|nr:hypothetical protein [bacterium]
MTNKRRLHPNGKRWFYIEYTDKSGELDITREFSPALEEANRQVEFHLMGTGYRSIDKIMESESQ